jgi:DNA-binding FadR family transcriptional regulator
VEELTPPVPRYEQLAGILRRAIFDGGFPGDASGPVLARHYGVSQPVVQRAFEALEGEGLLRMEPGRRTSVLARERWRIEFGARPGPDSAVRTAEAAAAVSQPAVSDLEATAAGDGLRVRMTVESASLPGAVTAALAVARQLLGPLAITVMSAAGE